jgi:hypothetical protein
MNKKIVITESQFKRLRNLIKEELLLEDKLFNQISSIFRNVEIKSENDAKALLSKPESKPLFTYIENAVNNSLNARVPKQKAEYIKTLKNKLKAIFKMQQKPDDEVLTILADVLNGYAKIKNVNSFENIVEMLKQANTSGDQSTKAKSIDDLLNRPMGPSNQQKQEPNDKAAGSDGTDEPKTEINQMIYQFVEVLNDLKENDILTIKLPRMDTMKLKCLDNKSKYSVFFTLADNEDTATEKIELPKIPEKYKFNEDSPVPNFDVMSIEYINDEGVVTKKKEIIQGVYEWDIDEGDSNEGGETTSDEIADEIADPDVSVEEFIDDIVTGSEKESSILDLYRSLSKDAEFMKVQGAVNPSFWKLLAAKLTGKEVKNTKGNIPVLNSNTISLLSDKIMGKINSKFTQNRMVTFKPLEDIEIPYTDATYDFTTRTRAATEKIFSLKSGSEYKFEEAVKVKEFSIDSLDIDNYIILENGKLKFTIIVKKNDPDSENENVYICDVIKYYKNEDGENKASKVNDVRIEFLDSDGYKTNPID